MLQSSISVTNLALRIFQHSNMQCNTVNGVLSHSMNDLVLNNHTWKIYLGVSILPTPGEAKAKAMPGRLYIHTK